MTADVLVGPFRVADLTYREAVAQAARLAIKPDGVRRFYALHVGGLNNRADRCFVDEMNNAELACADGGSVVLLAKLAGATRIERTPTTDAGWDVLAEVTRLLGHPARTAVIGGHPGLADIASASLSDAGVADIVLTAHGYQYDWAPILHQIQAVKPEVILLGLGAPKEMLWVRAHHDEIPPCLIVTCGGWLGFLAGTEQRAPTALRRSGIEWIARVAQSPRRLLPRYLKGVASFVALAWQAMRPRGRAAADRVAALASHSAEQRCSEAQRR